MLHYACRYGHSRQTLLDTTKVSLHFRRGTWKEAEASQLRCCWWSNLGRFKFTAQGTRVAVYYEDGVGRMECAIGEVVKVESVDSGVVNFMESTGKNSYRWPGSPYIDTISCRYVVDSDFGMTTATGRIWNIEKPKQLAKTFTAYLKKFVTV